MTIAEVDSGTLTATGSEQTLDTITGAGVYDLVLDLSNMASGDTVVVKLKMKAISAGSAGRVFTHTFSGAQSNPITISEPVVSIHEITWTLQQTAGTNRNYPWATRSVG